MCSGVRVALGTFPLNGLTRLNLLTEGVLGTVQLLDCVDQQQSKDCLQSEKKLFFKFRDCGKDAKRCHYRVRQVVFFGAFSGISYIFVGRNCCAFFKRFFQFSLFQYHQTLLRGKLHSQAHTLMKDVALE